jgi:Protein of unknown function (DUF3800)
MLRYANIYFDESGDTGDPKRGSQTESFVVGCVYVPDYNYHACVTSLEPLLGYSSFNRAYEIKASNAEPEQILRVLVELVNYDCRFGAIQINKREVKNYSSFQASTAGKYVRTNMILSLLESLIKTHKIKIVIRAHIDRFPATDTERRDLGDYLANNIAVKFGNTLFVHHPHSHTCLGVRCADHVAYSVLKKAEPQYSKLFDVIKDNMITWSEIMDADFFRI